MNLTCISRLAVVNLVDLSRMVDMSLDYSIKQATFDFGFISCLAELNSDSYTKQAKLIFPRR